MNVPVNTTGYVHVTLSRSNLQNLLAKLDAKSTKGLVRLTENNVTLVVEPQEDDVHYADRPVHHHPEARAQAEKHRRLVERAD